MSLAILFHFLCAQHVSDINISIVRSLWLLLNYHIGRLVLSSLCVGDLVRLVLGGVRFAGFSLQNENHQYQPQQISNTQRTENKTTDVVIQQQSQAPDDGYINVRNMSSTYKMWNKIASDIRLVFHSSTIKVMHGPINVSPYKGVARTAQ